MNYLRFVIIIMVTLLAGCPEIQVPEEQRGPVYYGYIDLQIDTNVPALIYSGDGVNRELKLLGPTPKRVRVSRSGSGAWITPALRIVQEGYTTKRIAHIPHQYKSYPTEKESERNPTILTVNLNKPQTMYGAFRVDSDPPGADVYNWNGDHVGNTSNGPVMVVATGEKPWEELFDGGVTPWLPSTTVLVWLKKDEFDNTPIEFHMYYRHSSSVTAEIEALSADRKLVTLDNKKIWASIKIRSDLRARVYSTDGTYWGESGPDDDESIHRVLWLGQRQSTSRQYTIVLKKSGCKETRHTFKLNYKYKTKDETNSNYDSVFAVLDPCG